MQVTEELQTVQARAGDPLVARARAGDHDAFAALVESHLERALRLARAITANDADARDATQDAFVAVWKALPRLRDEARFGPWLDQIVVNQCRDLLRRRRRVREIAIDDVEMTSPDPTPGRLAHAAVLAAFDRLSIAERQILVLHHLEGHPVTEIASRLGIPIGTAKSRLFSARKSLERELEDEA